MVQNPRGALQFGQVISDVASGIAMSLGGPTTALTSYKAARKKVITKTELNDDLDS